MNYRNTLVLITGVIIIGFLGFIFPALPLQGDNKTFLTISTFLFAIFAGFFISRQNARSADIRSCISRFDGITSYIYRNLDHFDTKVQQTIGAIIQEHYKLILEHKAWNYHITHASFTLRLRARI